MSFLLKVLAKLGLFKTDLDYRLLRASMVIIYFFFGYQKWFDYEAKGLIPFFTHGPLIFWMYPVFGIKGSTLFSRRFGMALRSLVVGRLLEQEIRRARCSRFGSHFCIVP